MSDIMDALKQFEAAEANLVKTEKTLGRAPRLFPTGITFDTSPEYEDRAHSLATLLGALRAPPSTVT